MGVCLKSCILHLWVEPDLLHLLRDQRRPQPEFPPHEVKLPVPRVVPHFRAPRRRGWSRCGRARHRPQRSPAHAVAPRAARGRCRCCARRHAWMAPLGGPLGGLVLPEAAPVRRRFLIHALAVAAQVASFVVAVSAARRRRVLRLGRRARRRALRRGSGSGVPLRCCQGGQRANVAARLAVRGADAGRADTRASRQRVAVGSGCGAVGAVKAWGLAGARAAGG